MHVRESHPQHWSRSCSLVGIQIEFGEQRRERPHACFEELRVFSVALITIIEEVA